MISPLVQFQKLFSWQSANQHSKMDKIELVIPGPLGFISLRQEDWGRERTGFVKSSTSRIQFGGTQEAGGG